MAAVTGRLRRGAVIGAAIVAATLLSAAPARAETAPEVRELAARAAEGDERALARLRAVSEVDGRPADLGPLLRGSEGDVAARLRELARSGPRAGRVGDPAGEAGSIVSGPDFEPRTVPRPFRGALEWLGEKLRTVARPFTWLADRVPGGAWTAAVICAALLLLAVAVVARRLGGRRVAVVLGEARRLRDLGTEDPAELEREAERAERDGQLECALRLRFRAGLVRLARADAIPRSELTSGQLRRHLRLTEFDRLAARFDEVAYGGRAPSPDDVAAARAGWPVVIDQARKR